MTLQTYNINCNNTRYATINIVIYICSKVASTINERIKEAYGASGFRSVNAMAKALGVLQQTLNACMAGKAEPRASLIAAILNGLPNISARWLVCGVGPMCEPAEAGHTVSGTGNAVGVSAGGGVTVSAAAPPEAASLKAEVERLRAVIECKDGEIAFLRGALTARKERWA